MTGPVYFSPLKKDRGDYFVEYQPPPLDSETAFLHLTFSREVEFIGHDKLVDAEIRAWLLTYPVPTMAWAFDSTDSSLKPPGRPWTCLVGWIGSDGSPVAAIEKGKQNSRFDRAIYAKKAGDPQIATLSL